ncbi:hypothetical protein MNBD_UNCLBAC01-1513 [hydrothermal vent metagenome]|uniref:Uncharacterized protein n=1 Tax=hydrothermal vent metagenome TaxID=652676 RepID=A0A3B1DP31_9ZZZZ
MKILYIFILILNCIIFYPDTLWAAWKGVRGDFNVGMQVEYDDNVTSTVDANKKSDLINELTLGVVFGQEGKTQSWNIKGDLIQSLFTNNTLLNNLSQYLKGNYKKEISKYDRLNVTNVFTRAESISRFEDSFGENIEPFRYFRNRFNAQYERDLAKRFAMKADYMNEIYETERTTSADSILNKYTLELDYIKASDLFFLMEYGLTTRHYSTGEDTNLHDFLSGGRYYFTSVFYMDIRAGVSLVKTFDNQNLIEPKYRVMFIQNTNESTQISFTYQKDNSAGSARREVFDSWRISGNLYHQVLQRLAVNSTIFYGEGQYNSSGLGDTLSGGRVQLNYDIREKANLTLAYRYAKTDSTQDSRDSVRNVVTLGLTVKF